MSEKETKKWKKLSQTIQEEGTAERNEAYNDYVKEVTPTHNLVANMVKAFFTGGVICCIGQFLLNTCQGLGLDKDNQTVVEFRLTYTPTVAEFGGIHLGIIVAKVFYGNHHNLVGGAL